MSCFQLNVGGSGTTSPATVEIPGVYSAEDPGILINIYQSLTAYESQSHTFVLDRYDADERHYDVSVPGPTPFASASPAVANTPYPTTATWNTADQPSTVPTAPVGAPTASSPASSPASGSSSASTPAPTSTASSAPSQTSSAAGATQTKYGQCGGTGWTGPTTCVSGSTCSAVSPPYYYQVSDCSSYRGTWKGYSNLTTNLFISATKSVDETCDLRLVTE